MEKDIRWKQRLQNFNKAFQLLDEAVQMGKQRPLSNLEKQGLIQAFEFTHELAWNVMKDYFDFQGTSSIIGPRDATREAFQKGLLTDGDEWMEMLKSRNLTSHTYNLDTANSIVDKIQKSYLNLFKAFQKKMQDLSNR